MAQDIARLLRSRGVRDIRLFGTNVEVITNNVRVLVRTAEDKHIRGRRVDACFGYTPRTTMFVTKDLNATPQHSSGLIDYILKEENAS